MKAFEWVNATSVTQAVELLHAAAPDIDDAPRPIAGGQDLLTNMKDYLARPTRVVNLKTIRGLDRIEGNAKTGLRIGALVKLSELEENSLVRQNFSSGIVRLPSPPVTETLAPSATSMGARSEG